MDVNIRLVGEKSLPRMRTQKKEENTEEKIVDVPKEIEVFSTHRFSGRHHDQQKNQTHCNSCNHGNALPQTPNPDPRVTRMRVIVEVFEEICDDLIGCCCVVI